MFLDYGVMSKVSQLGKVILFFYFLLHLSNLSDCSDSSAQLDQSSKISEQQNTLYDDIDEEESQSLERSKRDDLNKDSDYTYEDEEVDENVGIQEMSKLSTAAATDQKSPKDANVKKSPEISAKKFSIVQKSPNEKLNTELVRKDTSELTLVKDQSANFDEKLNATLELVKKQLEESFDRKLTKLHDEMRKETELRQSLEKTLDGSSVACNGGKLVNEISETSEKNDKIPSVEKRYTMLEKKRDRVQKKRESKHRKKRRKSGPNRREARDKKAPPRTHEAMNKPRS